MEEKQTFLEGENTMDGGLDLGQFVSGKNLWNARVEIFLVWGIVS